MCGIFGLFNTEPSDAKLDAMQNSLRHRGPDGQGRLKRLHSGIGMTRLAILDERFGHQPFFSQNGRVAVVMNGEIYNWRSLRETLRQRGHHFRTECDTEIIPAAWQEWGHKMLERFNGMFAIALLEGEKLFLARDPVGQKPLYLAKLKDGSHAFASEIPALKAAGHELDINFQSLEHWLALRYVPEPETLVSGVKTLRAGHYLTWQPGAEPEIHRWWYSPPLDYEPAPNDNKALSELGSLVDSSAELALESDRPLSCYLSAGIDSALLLDAIKRADGDVKTLTASFGANSDEGQQAREVAQTYGFSHQHIHLSADSLDDLPRVVHQMGTPVADGLILAFDALAKTSADIGCPVALGGEGPDELFQGYSFQQTLQRTESMGSTARYLASLALKFAPQATIEARNPFPAPLGMTGRQKVTEWMSQYSAATPWEKGIGLRTLFSPAAIRDLLLDPLWIEPKLSPGTDLQDQHHRHQFVEWLPDWSIIRQDRNAMAHSVEYRMPFLDPRLIAFSGQLGSSQKLRGKTGKWIWRELAKTRLPRSFATRPKQPFYFPLEQFANSRQWRTLVGDLLSPSALNEDYIFRSESVEKLKTQAETGEFLPLKQLMALVIFQLWKNQLPG